MSEYDPTWLTVGRDLTTDRFGPPFPPFDLFGLPNDLGPQQIYDLLGDARLSGESPWTNEGTPFYRMGNAISRWDEPLHDRFIVLLGAHTTIASVARVRYQEETLTDDEMMLHLASSVLFFNSFTHR